MQSNKDYFMELRAAMSVETYEQIPESIRHQMQIKTVEPTDFDYSIFPEWVKAKKKSDEAYKELKRIEFFLRHR